MFLEYLGCIGRLLSLAPKTMYKIHHFKKTHYLGRHGVLTMCMRYARPRRSVPDSLASHMTNCTMNWRKFRPQQRFYRAQSEPVRTSRPTVITYALSSVQSFEGIVSKPRTSTRQLNHKLADSLADQFAGAQLLLGPCLDPAPRKQGMSVWTMVVQRFKVQLNMLVIICICWMRLRSPPGTPCMALRTSTLIQSPPARTYAHANLSTQNMTLVPN